MSLDGKPLEESSRVLLVYATDALNNGAIYENYDRTIIDKGTVPVLICSAVYFQSH